jgi:glycosyltransferase involved in cell wall biosynthesis
MKPKISMLGSLPPIKGISPYTLNLVKELSKKVEIDFYNFKSIYPEIFYPGGTKTNEKEPKIKNVKIHNYLAWYNPFSWIKTGFAIKTDLLHVQWWAWTLAPIYLTILGIAKLRNKKIVMTIHNVKMHENSLIPNFLNKTVINLADEYIVHSEDNKKTFLNQFKTNKKVKIIPHPIIEFPISSIPKEILKRKYGFKKEDKILIFFGNIRPYKGLDVLLKTFGEIKNSNLKLIIAGQVWGSFSLYQNLIDNLNLKDRVKLFLGYNNKDLVAELFKISDIAVFPYKKFDAASGALSVAMFYKKPVIITDVMTIDKNYKSYKIAKSGDSIDLKNKIESY